MTETLKDENEGTGGPSELSAGLGSTRRGTLTMAQLIDALRLYADVATAGNHMHWGVVMYDAALVIREQLDDIAKFRDDSRRYRWLLNQQLGVWMQVAGKSQVQDPSPNIDKAMMPNVEFSERSAAGAESAGTQG